MNEELDPILDTEQLAAGLSIDEQLQQRFEDMFKQCWNTKILPFVKQMINEKIAEEAMKLGRQMGELRNHKGEL
jgi:hypothetical protein